ncbi:MAG: hypothetical protein US58_C0022G0012 [Candidatus Magasanikbacteria bacterium GW2011_GWA2_37_8]|uniref:Uncharacterized protein n=1 Tax=Candidatus Magasanikbacteria bacterium GW2011_GWA2_37_8 TaxID=1619036 RepID=A0A0G0HAH1_9BACT|nr:MAG: hypothetical protein US58_C0022G0012 [Candidatus Magasanikbacteria bacterium GW2011_GWA2_37_8]
MGSYIELNDTLQITAEQGFPEDILNLSKHQSDPINLEDVSEKIFEFQNKPKARLYHLPPNRCFLVQNINGKWLYWGKIIMIEQTISSNIDGAQTTSGKYKIIEIYDPEYQIQITKHETSEGLGYF